MGNAGHLGHRGVDVHVGLESQLHQGDAVGGLRADLQQVVHVVEGGDFRKRGDFRRHLRRVQAAVGPDQRDFRALHARQDVGGHPPARHDAEKQDQDRENPDGVFVAKGEEDDPHGELGARRPDTDGRSRLLARDAPEAIVRSTPCVPISRGDPRRPCGGRCGGWSLRGSGPA